MRFITDETADIKRVDSDRESLPFPEGGVFAGQRPAKPEQRESDDMIQSTDDVIASIDRLFDVMQDQIDTIADEVDEHFRIHPEDDDFDPRPAA